MADQFLPGCLWRAQETIAGQVHRIGICERDRCGKFFIIRKRAKFCSPQCSQQVRLARFNAELAKLTEAELKERRQAAYLRRLWKLNRGAARTSFARLAKKDADMLNRLVATMIKPWTGSKQKPAQSMAKKDAEALERDVAQVIKSIGGKDDGKANTRQG